MGQICLRNDSEEQTGHSICTAGRDLYRRAVHGASVAAPSVPSCLRDLKLMLPDPDQPDKMVAIRPSTALSMLLQPIDHEIRHQQQAAAKLQFVMEAVETVYRSSAHRSDEMVSVLEGLEVINARIDQATSECTFELLTAQPGGGRSEEVLSSAMKRVNALIDRGAQIRTLYQHTARYDLATSAFAELLDSTGQAEVRTLAELFERLIIFDRKVAFIPARKDRQVALEIRQPAIVSYLVGMFERIWHYGVPLSPSTPTSTTNQEVIPQVQRSIAQLLVAGHMDEPIARRCRRRVNRDPLTADQN